MKKLLYVFIITLSLSGFLSADQLAYITKEQADKGVALIRSQKEVLLFCGCCENDPKIYLQVTGVDVQPAGYEDYCKIIITGTNSAGEKLSVEADLAYVHIRIKEKAVAAGKILGFECDPCVTELKWESDNR